MRRAKRIACAGVLLSLTAAGAPLFEQRVAYKAGESGIHTYRIPALLTTKKGTLLGFCEARRDGQGDSGAIRTVLKRSRDNGRTWTAQQVVVDHGGNTIGNPCPVVDRKTGTIWLLLTGNPGDTNEDKIFQGIGPGTRTVWLTKSADDGKTWAPAIEITASVKKPDWTWYATGPGNGIQLSSGRLVIPCCHAQQGSDILYSHVIYSDDHGASWKLGGSAGPKTDEAAVVELEDGTLLMNMRNDHGKSRRAIARSRDGGATWSELSFDETLVEPGCQGSLVRIALVGKPPRAWLLFSNPADPKKRIRMTVRMSDDGGQTWPVARVVHEGPSAYSSLAVLRDGTFGLLFERGVKGFRETITFLRFNRDWLSQGGTPSQ
jgi:sialidase-1